MVAWRFSLARLFWLISVVAIACAALVHPTTLWSTAVASTTVAVLFYAILAAVYRVGAQRAYWVGMLAVGWGYFWLAFLPSWLSSGEELPLVTTQLLRLLDEVRPQAPAVYEPALMPAAAVSTGAFDSFQIYTATNPPPTNPPLPPGSLIPTTISYGADDTEDFRVIGQCLWTLLLGSIGGLVARRLYNSRVAHECTA